jgi:hypothetical protein
MYKRRYVMRQLISYFVAVLLTALIADTAFAGENKLRKLPCSVDQIIRSDGAGFVCSQDIDTDTDTDTLGSLSCFQGQVPKFDIATGRWACGFDTDTDTDTDTLGDLACTRDQIAKFDVSTGGWVCGFDTDTDTDTLGDLACTADQIAKFDVYHSAGGWVCANARAPGLNNVVLVEGPGVILTRGVTATDVADATCPAGTIIVGGGYQIGSGTGSASLSVGLNRPFINTLSGESSWRARAVYHDGVPDTLPLTPFALCAAIGVVP